MERVHNTYRVVIPTVYDPLENARRKLICGAIFGLLIGLCAIAGGTVSVTIEAAQIAIRIVGKFATSKIHFTDTQTAKIHICTYIQIYMRIYTFDRIFTYCRGSNACWSLRLLIVHGFNK